MQVVLMLKPFQPHLRQPKMPDHFIRIIRKDVAVRQRLFIFTLCIYSTILT
jgi:hypothetical protein